MKLQALDIIGKDAGNSRNQVHHFIRLINLIHELLKKMVSLNSVSLNLNSNRSW